MKGQYMSFACSTLIMCDPIAGMISTRIRTPANFGHSQSFKASHMHLEHSHSKATNALTHLNQMVSDTANVRVGEAQ